MLSERYFGRNRGLNLLIIPHLVSLPRNQVPEWASSYINYKGLKKLIRSAAEALRSNEEPDLTGQCVLVEGSVEVN